MGAWPRPILCSGVRSRANPAIIVLNKPSISMTGQGISTMRSFIDLDATFDGQPRELGPVLARIDTGRGREQLFEDQVPEVLKQLSENARIASITASNAIEGVVVDS